MSLDLLNMTNLSRMSQFLVIGVRKFHSLPILDNALGLKDCLQVRLVYRENGP